MVFHARHHTKGKGKGKREKGKGNVFSRYEYFDVTASRCSPHFGAVVFHDTMACRYTRVEYGERRRLLIFSAVDSIDAVLPEPTV
jgi:hypothetical protein